jgi:uncharacterized protein (TIGR02246 family)
MAEDERQRVLRANDAFYTAFERLDASLMAEAWRDADHVRCVHPGGAVFTGRVGVLRGWEDIFSQTLSIRFELSRISVRVSGDLACVTLVEDMTMTARDGASRGAVAATNVFERWDGRWWLIVHHASPLPHDVPGFTPPPPSSLH